MNISNWCATIINLDRQVEKINAPFIRTKEYILNYSPSLSIKVSLDNEETWNNNIFQNSRYAIFMIHDSDKSFELISKHFSLPKFRKRKYKAHADVIEKINKWIESI